LNCFKGFCSEHIEDHKKHSVFGDLTKKCIVCTACKIEFNEITLKNSSEHSEKLEDLFNEVIPVLIRPKTSTKHSYKNIIKTSKKNTEEVKIEYTVTKPIKGLTNFGNTCYFNSAIQCLNATKELVECIKSSGGQLHKRFKEFTNGIASTKGPVYSSNNLLKAIQGKSGKFIGHQQQDAHELLIALFDKLIDEDLASKKGANQFESPVMNTIGSYLTNKGKVLNNSSSLHWM